jgi:DNA polymerase III subunit epsilon
LGTAANEAEVEELLSEKQPEFDLDIYKIMRKTLKKTKELGLRVTTLPSNRYQHKAALFP